MTGPAPPPQAVPDAAVLVTGAAGYIGSHAVLALCEAGYSVVALDDLSAGRRAAVPSGIPFVEGSVGDAGLVRGLLAEHGIGAVLHFAGSIFNAESLDRPLHYYGNNACASRTLIAACAEAGIGRFVFSSSAVVYGEPNLVPVPKDAPTAPITPYGSSKLVTEWILRDLATVSDLRYVALRYFNVAGADPNGPPARPRAAPPTSSRLRSRPPPVSATASRSSATTIRRPTAPASTTTSSSPTWSKRIWPPCAGSRPAGRA